MTSKNRPSALTAVLELSLVLAVGLIVLGVVRGWFVQAETQQKGLLMDVTAGEPQPAEKRSRTRHTPPTPLWSTAGETPSPFAAASSSAGPGDASTWNARMPAAEEQPN